MRYSLIIVALCIVFCYSITTAHAQIQSSSITVKLEEITIGLGGSTYKTPTDLVPLGDNGSRIAVTTLAGVVRLLDANGAFLDSEASPYLDTTNEPNRRFPLFFSYGMTCAAFHPDFSTEGAVGFGKLFTVITETPHGTNPFNADLLAPASVPSEHQDVIVEWTASDPTINNPTFTRRDVIRFDQPTPNHNVTDIVFGNDGLLYLAAGDGGPGQLFAQQSDNFLGSILRIDPLDPDSNGTRSTTHSGTWINMGAEGNTNPGAGAANYRIPSGSGGNPGAGIPGQVDEIFAIGFRSPYRLNVDRLTGDLYVGDVGAGAIEEVDVVVNDGNYGWGRFEGTLLRDETILLENNDPHVLPLFEYNHNEGETVIGGLVYRGSALPDLVGKYVFANFGRQVAGPQIPTPARLFAGDVSTGVIEELMIDPTGELLAEIVKGNLTSRQFILSIGEDANGELYLVVGDDPQFPRAINPDGRILRLTAGSVPVLGDANDDGLLNNLDISSFVLALTNLPAYQDMFPDLDPDVVLDMNGDGGFDNLDIADFVAALTGGGTK